MKRLLILGFAMFRLVVEASAQLPVYGIIYLQTPTHIYNYDPAQPVSANNPALNSINLPSGGSEGFAISNNLNGPGPSPTFYTTVNGYYYYYDGSTWVNTGNVSHGVNLGGGKDFIYSFNGDVYKYDGSSAAFVLPLYISGYDVITDSKDNFYILWDSLRKFSPSGNLLEVWTPATPMNSIVLYSSGGLACIGDTLYYTVNLPNAGGSLVCAPLFSNNFDTVSFINVSTYFADINSINDMASCPRPAGSNDTIYYCSNSQAIPVTSNGEPPYVWSVLSGSALITGSGSSVSISTNADAVVFCRSGSCFIELDTFHLIASPVTIDAGVNDTIAACGIFQETDTLHAVINNVQPGVNYDVHWEPTASIISGGNTLTPIVQSQFSEIYTLKVSLPPNEGGCVWLDSVWVVLKDLSVNADFNYDLHFGCMEDTIVLNNQSINADSYLWRFGDGALDSTNISPAHIYSNQDLYIVQLIASNILCSDTVHYLVDTKHPLNAAFISSSDTACQNAVIGFINTSGSASINAPINFQWTFGDEIQDTVSNPIHKYQNPGTYDIALIVSDAFSCSDTAIRKILIDPLPSLSFSINDTVLCEGKQVSLLTNFESGGITGLTWDFGDGTIFSGYVSAMQHAYDTAGLFQMKLTAKYRSCPDSSVSKIITVNPYARIDLGPDTSICPGSTPIILSNHIVNRVLQPGYWWNTGDTTNRLVVLHPGVYTLREDLNGCSSADSIEIFKDCYIDVPNIFTPNGDGINDYFFPREQLSSQLTAFKMHIYNRWGQLIFETNNIEGRGWDGKLNGNDQPDGVYVYLIEATIGNEKKERHQGNLTLLR